MKLGLLILFAMLSTLLSTEVSAATCRLKVLLASGVAITAESVHSSDGWTFIHLDENGVLGVPDSHVLSTDEDCDPLDEAATEAPWPLQVMTSPQAGLSTVAPAQSDEARDARERPDEAAESLAPSGGVGDGPPSLSGLEKLRNRNTWWLPRSGYAQEDDLIRPEEYDRSVNWLRNRNRWWWPHSSYAQEDALLNRAEDQSALDALRFDNSWWWPTSDFAEQDELVGGRRRWP